MTKESLCNPVNCPCHCHQNDDDFVVEEIVKIDSDDKNAFNQPKKHLTQVKKIIVQNNPKTKQKSVVLCGEPKPEAKSRKRGKRTTTEEIYEFLQREAQKNEDFRNKQEKWNQNQEQKMTAIEAKVDQKISDLEQKFNEKIDGLEQKFDQKINNLEQKVDEKIDGLEQKFDQKINDIKVEIKNLEQKVDEGFTEINQRLDRIENCPTIKKELAEQDNENLITNEDQKKKGSEINNLPNDDDKKED